MSGTSPTLTLKVTAPAAVQSFKELRAEADALKASLAGLNNVRNQGASAGVTRLEAEVRELRASLQATRLELEKYHATTQNQSRASVASAQREAAAARERAATVVAANRQEQVAIESKTVARRAEAAAARLAAAEVRAAAAEQLAAERRMAGITRSAARGVAGAAGGMFLTYGASIPALAAAYGTASAIKGSVTQGTEFQYQTAFTGALGQYSPEQVAKLREELRKLGTDSIYGPIELAKGMRVLEQAGVDANDALKVLPVSMKMALQGETDLTKASETLIGVMRQFDLSISDIPKIGDAISKTAAVTQANIPSLMEALKAATGLSRYGVDLNTALASIGLLAKQGVTGSSGGTFFRRFVEDLYTPKSQGAQRALRDIGFTPYNQDGSLKEFRNVQEQFVGKLQGYDPQSRINLLGQIFDIRAAKQASAYVTDLAGEFKKLRGEIDQSEGALSAFSKAMSAETKMLWEQVKNNFEGVLIDAFKTIEPQLKTLLNNMRDFFKDPAVTDFLKLLMLVPKGFVGLANITEGARKNLRPDDAARLEQINSAISRYSAAGGSETGAGLRSDQLRQQLALRAEILAKLNPAAADHSLDASVYGFRAGEMAGSVGGQLGALPADKRAKLRVNDPLAWKEQHDLLAAQEQASSSAGRRAFQKIEDDTTFAQRLLEEKHRGGLISEEKYTNEIDRLNDKRTQDAIESTNAELQNLHDYRQLRETAAEKMRNDERVTDLQAKRDHLLRESQFQKDLVRLRQEGAANLVSIETQKLVRKHQEAGTEYRAGLQLSLNAPLMPEVVAAGYASEQQTRRQFLEDLRAVDEQISKKGTEGDQGEIAALKERKRLLQETMSAQIRLNAEAAKAAKETERSYEYGRDTTFVQFVDAARNSAQQAREVWSSALNGITGVMTRFFMTGKMQWRDFAASIIEMLIRIRVERAMAGVLDAFLPTVGGGGVGSGDTGAGDIFGVTTVGTAHTGGVAGLLRTTRAVNASVFAGAPRFHSGGVAGDEVPIIARRGEGVFTPSQMRAMGGGMPSSVRVELVNQGTPQQVTKAEPRIDADGMVIRIITRDIRNNGPIAQELASTYQMERSAG